MSNPEGYKFGKSTIKNIVGVKVVVKIFLTVDMYTRK